MSLLDLFPCEELIILSFVQYSIIEFMGNWIRKDIIIKPTFIVPNLKYLEKSQLDRIQRAL